MKNEKTKLLHEWIDQLDESAIDDLYSEFISISDDGILTPELLKEKQLIEETQQSDLRDC